MTRRWGVLAFIFAGILISYIDRGNLSIAAASIMQAFGLPPGSMGVLLSAFFWTYGAFQIPAGFLIDRFGIRRAYAAGFFIWSLASSGIALSRGFGDILSLRMALGLAEAVGPIASIAFIRQNFAGREQGLPTSLYIAGQNLGPAFGALLGTALLARFGWRFMFAATGLGALLWLPGWLYVAPSKDSVVVTEAAVSPSQWPWRAILRSPAFWAMSLSVFFLSYYWYFVLTWLPTYLTMARGFSTLGMGRVLSTPLFAMAIVSPVAGGLADKLIARFGSVFQVRIVFAAAGLIGAGAILLLEVMPEHNAVLPVLVVSVCSFGIASASFWAISQHVPPASIVGRAIGYLNTISQLAGVTAPLITGWSLGPRKQFGFAIFLAGMTPLMAAVLLLVAGPRGLDKLRDMLAASPEGLRCDPRN